MTVTKEGVFIVQYFILLFFLGAAAYFDVREHRIPNWWVFLGMSNGMVLAIFQAGSPSADFLLLKAPFWFLLRMLAATAVFFLFFLCRMIGAGDIKLAALICGYLGFRTGSASIGAGFLIGAFWSLIKMAGKGSLLYRLSCFLTYIRYVFQTGKITAYYHPDRDGYDMVIPLGPCLFLGTFITIVALQ
ncbi:prepilin peptidase [Lacrimispora sp. JR3]|uniref:prepilin peptidase n=1 Tax=Lacrimispora sinapis TaxID=3111456 RepID=UPI00374A5211